MYYKVIYVVSVEKPDSSSIQTSRLRSVFSTVIDPIDQKSDANKLGHFFLKRSRLVFEFGFRSLGLGKIPSSF